MRTEITLADDKETELAGQGRAIIAEGATFAIVRDDPHRDAALAFGQRIKRMRGMVSDLFDDPIEQAHKLHKSLCGRRNTLDGPLAEADTAVKRGIGTYEANKRAAIEAQRRAEEAEARRKAEELEAARQREIVAARKIAEDKRLADAAALEAAGKSKEADAMLAAPIYVVPPPTVETPQIVERTPMYQPPKGTSTRVTWKARIVNPDLIPREFMMPDEKKIGAWVRANEQDHGIPGVEAYSEASASLR